MPGSKAGPGAEDVAWASLCAGPGSRTRKSLTAGNNTNDKRTGRGAPVELKHGQQRIYVVGVVYQQVRNAVRVHAGLALLKQGLDSLHTHASILLLPHGALKLPEVVDPL